MRHSTCAAWTFALAALVFALSAAQAADGPRWIAYEPAVVTLTGRIIKENYGEDASPIDRGRHVWILRLDRPVSLRAKPDDEIDTEERNVTEVHLNADHAKHPVARAAFGKKRFAATGTLYHAHTAHHLRPIVMLVSSIRPLPPKSRQQR